MNRLILFLLLKLIFSNKIPFMKKAFIKNTNLPICSNCKHFIEYKRRDDLLPDITLSKCKKFGAVNIVTGEIKYEYADRCRHDKDKCGIYGDEYESKDDMVFPPVL